MGLNRDVLMESDKDFSTKVHNENSEIKDSSKNVYVASTHGGARLSS